MHLLRIQSKIDIIKQYIAIIKDWDESKHRRDERGRFTHGSSSLGGMIERLRNLKMKINPEYRDRLVKVGHAIAKSLNFPPANVSFIPTTEFDDPDGEVVNKRSRDMVLRKVIFRDGTVRFEDVGRNKTSDNRSS